LRGVGALVDDRERLAVAEMNRSRPGENTGDAQAIKFGIAVVTRVDLHANDGRAVAVSWQRVELAGATVSAIAICKFATVNRPCGFGHGKLPTKNTSESSGGRHQPGHPILSRGL